MKKILTIFGALAVASSPALALNIAPHQTQKLKNVLKTTSNFEGNTITVFNDTKQNFKFSVFVTNSEDNGFSGFLDQISFSLSEYDYHAWPVYLFQWLDDNDFWSTPFPDLNGHTKHGFFNYPMVWANRLEEYMGHFGATFDDKSETAFKMASSWGLWGTFGQTVDNQWNQDRAASKPLTGVTFNFEFNWNGDDVYSTVTPTFEIHMS